MSRTILTASDIEAIPEGGEVVVPRDAIVTDEARELAAKLRVSIRVQGAVDVPSASRSQPVPKLTALELPKISTRCFTLRPVSLGGTTTSGRALSSYCVRQPPLPASGTR